jgi:YD repeat-containing protein
MRTWKLIVAPLIFIAATPFAHSQYGEYLYVTGASVSGSIVGGPATPSATLTVTINKNDNSQTSTSPGIPLVISTNVGIGITCNANTALPYGYGCYATPGSKTISIGLSHAAVSEPTLVTFNVAVEYDGDPGQNVQVQVLPVFSPSPSDTGHTCPACEAGRPINLANGNTLIEQTDIRTLPGTGMGLTLSRTWNSKWPSNQIGSNQGMFGPNWLSTYEERVFVGSDGTIKYLSEDGGFKSFSYSSSAWTPVSPAAFKASLSTGVSNWILTFRSGEQRVFDNASGNLVGIIDRNGNTTSLTYDGLNRLVSVADPSSRHLYFNYPDSTSRLVSSVTTDVGHSISYSYDNLGRLLQVVENDSSKLLFEYDANSFITAVKDGNGKVIEAHTYDSAGRGLSSTKADGVEALTVTYPTGQTY